MQVFSVPTVDCKQYTSHVTFFSCLRACVIICHTTLALVFVRVISSSTLASHSSFVSPIFHFILLNFDFYVFLFHVDVAGARSPLCTLRNEESGPLDDNAPLTGYEPNFIDNYHFSETTENFIQGSSNDTRPSYLHDAEISDDTIGRAFCSPLFTQEREEPASHRQAYHSLEESLLPSQSLSVGHVRTGRPVFDEFGSLMSNVSENPSRDSENEQIRILLERQKEQILTDYRAERFRNTSSRPIMTEEVSKS